VERLSVIVQQRAEAISDDQIAITLSQLHVGEVVAVEEEVEEDEEDAPSYGPGEIHRPPYGPALVPVAQFHAVHALLLDTQQREKALQDRLDEFQDRQNELLVELGALRQYKLDRERTWLQRLLGR
jgi:hypothetical protein